MEDYRMNLRSYKEACLAGMMDEEEVKREVEKMKEAPVGHIEPNAWEKVGEDSFIVYSL